MCIKDVSIQLVSFHLVEDTEEIEICEKENPQAICEVSNPLQSKKTKQTNGTSVCYVKRPLLFQDVNYFHLDKAQKEQLISPCERVLKVELFPHQKEAVDWMIQRETHLDRKTHEEPDVQFLQISLRCLHIFMPQSLTKTGACRHLGHLKLCRARGTSDSDSGSLSLVA